MTDVEEPSRPDLVVDVPITIGKLVRRVLCGNPGVMTGPGTRSSGASMVPLSGAIVPSTMA